MKQFGAAFIATIAIVAIGCGYGPEAKIWVIDDPAGQTIRIGTVMHLQWECDDCKNVTGTSIIVRLSGEKTGSHYGQSSVFTDVAFGPLTGPADWNTRKNLDGVAISPGLYKLTFWSYPADNTTGGPSGKNAYGASGVFRLVE